MYFLLYIYHYIYNDAYRYIRYIYLDILGLPINGQIFLSQ